MKFLKLNKLNEDFFDDVEIDNDNEVNDDNEQYELIIKLKPMFRKQIKFLKYIKLF